MKMTRDQLKKIIKECLVEILMEGAGEALTERRNTRPMTQSMPRRPSTLDMMPVRPAPMQRPQPQRHQMNEMVSSVTKDPIMAAILADTAQTTLVEQDSSARPVAGDQATRAVSAHLPTELFGEEAQARWNEAAFSRRSGPLMPTSNDLQIDYDPYAPVKNA